MTQQLGLSLKWQPSPETLNLNANELHLWWLPLTLDAVQSELALSLLNDIQRDKYYRRNTPTQKQAYLAGRFHLLNLLAAYQDCSAESILLSYSRLNKPYLNPNPHNIQFNFTDTQTNGVAVGLYAFCIDHELGVDIEAFNRQSDFTKIAPRRFTDNELTFIQYHSGNIDTQKALAVWTRKEAYGKAIGQGINFTMREHDLVNGHDISVNFRDENSDWRLTQIQLDDTHIACFVHQGHTPLNIIGFNTPYIQ